MAGRTSRHRKKKGPGYPGPLSQNDCATSLPAIATAAAATTPTEAAATATRTTATTGARLVLSLVDPQLATTHIVAVQALDGTGRVGLAHLNKPEATGATGLTIGWQRNGFDRAVLREQRTDVRLTGAERQIAYIDLGHKFKSLSKQLEAIGRN
jgi:hypothetical protein